MKTCPVCRATCFDDMDMCYGCLHRFEEQAPPKPAPPAAATLPEITSPASEDLSFEPEPALEPASATARKPEPACAPLPACETVSDDDAASSASAEGAASSPSAETHPSAPAKGPATRAAVVPLDRSGWIVRFEFPDQTPVSRASFERCHQSAAPATYQFIINMPARRFEHASHLVRIEKRRETSKRSAASLATKEPKGV